MAVEGLKCLNDCFKVLSYNGDLQDDQYRQFGLTNALAYPRQPQPHCTAKGANFDLLLEFTGPANFTLTHFIVTQRAIIAFLHIGL